jgi:hypothetical protein
MKARPAAVHGRTTGGKDGRGRARPRTASARPRTRRIAPGCAVIQDGSPLRVVGTEDGKCIGAISGEGYGKERATRA